MTKRGEPTRIQTDTLRYMAAHDLHIVQLSGGFLFLYPGWRKVRRGTVMALRKKGLVVPVVKASWKSERASCDVDGIVEEYGMSEAGRRIAAATDTES